MLFREFFLFRAESSPRNARFGGQTVVLVVSSPRNARFGGQIVVRLFDVWVESVKAISIFMSVSPEERYKTV